MLIPSWLGCAYLFLSLSHKGKRKTILVCNILLFRPSSPNFLSEIWFAVANLQFYVLFSPGWSIRNNSRDPCRWRQVCQHWHSEFSRKSQLDYFNLYLPIFYRQTLNILRASNKGRAQKHRWFIQFLFAFLGLSHVLTSPFGHFTASFCDRALKVWQLGRQVVGREERRGAEGRCL